LPRERQAGTELRGAKSASSRGGKGEETARRHIPWEKNGQSKAKQSIDLKGRGSRRKKRSASNRRDKRQESLPADKTRSADSNLLCRPWRKRRGIITNRRFKDYSYLSRWGRKGRGNTSGAISVPLKSHLGGKKATSCSMDKDNESGTPFLSLGRKARKRDVKS